MKVKPFILIGFLIIAAVGVTQNNNKAAYRRMEGSIGDDIEVTANFIRLFDKVEGNYQYKFKENDATTFYGKMLEIEGSVLKNDSLYLKEYGADDASFTGLWGDNSYRGQWKVPGEGNDYMEVLLKEYYPHGSLPFKVYYLNSEENLINGVKNSPTATIELTFIYPENNSLPVGILDSVKHIINKGFFGDSFKQSSPTNMLNDFEKEFYNNYKNSNLEEYKKMRNGQSFSWSSMNSMSVLFNSSYLLCVEYQRYAFTGGSHGITNNAYDIIDLKTGTVLTYNDIFTDNADSALSTLITNKMLKKYKTKDEANLKKLGFFVDRILPNQNVYITGNGIGFKYASYEIAPYSYGLPEVFLSFDECKDLIRSGTPVYQLSRQKQQ